LETFAEVTASATQEFGTGNHVYFFRRAPILINSLTLCGDDSSAEVGLVIMVMIVVMVVSAIFGMYMSSLFLWRVVVRTIFRMDMLFMLVFHLLFIVIMIMSVVMVGTHLRCSITYASEHGEGE
jgi:hypothetical protein